MHYLLSYGLAALVLGGLLTNKFLNKKDTKNIVNKIVALLAALIFVFRIFCYKSEIAFNKDYYWGLSSSPLHNNVLTAFSLLFIWFSYTGILFAILRPFFDVKFANNALRFLCVPLFVAMPALLKPMSVILAGPTNNTILLYFYATEIGLAMGISIYYLVSSIIDKEKPKASEIGTMFAGFLLLSIFTMPNYIPQYMIGEIPTTAFWKIKELTPYHRIVIYFGVIIPFVIYFSLMGRSETFRKYCLLFMCLGVVINFGCHFYYETFLQPWTWPFHLCNTALYILPLVLIFNMKRLFYFTYFINVVGALLAMLMPNYGDATNILSMRMLQFWYNHYFAFFMPILFVSLKMFERPKLRQFIYSMLGFLAYFVLVLVLNVVFTELGHEVDYFFLNSDFIPEKFGKWAEDMFDITLVLNVKDHSFVFHPVYQAVFFGTYILLGLAVWFVYGEGYRIADSNGALFIRLKRMRIQDKELKKALAGRKLEEPMEKDAGITFELRHFSKKYGTSKRFAVNDANLEVHGGEIFGFLGPNGAGKSTIIKSTVGIQPITSGNINICGYDVGKQPVQAKSMIGFVPDHYALYEKLTGREYVNYIADIYGVSKQDRDERIKRYVQRFELEHSFDNMIKTYSHGMKQKITIMAALVHDPKVWILDEPLTGLDPNSIYQVKECMKEHAAKGNIVFFSSHIIDIVEKLCQRIAIIKLGEIQCVKTVEEIEASGSTLEQFYLKTIGNEIEGISSEEDILAAKKRDKNNKVEVALNDDEDLDVTVDTDTTKVAKLKKKKKSNWFKNLFKKKDKKVEEVKVEEPVVEEPQPQVEEPVVEEPQPTLKQEHPEVEILPKPVKKAASKKTTTKKPAAKKPAAKKTTTKKTTAKKESK